MFSSSILSTTFWIVSVSDKLSGSSLIVSLVLINFLNISIWDEAWSYASLKISKISFELILKSTIIEISKLYLNFANKIKSDYL